MSGCHLWDVDTQVDFMVPEGKLYVPGADATRDAMARLVSARAEAGHRPRRLGRRPRADRSRDLGRARTSRRRIRRTACAGPRARRRSPRPSRSIRSRWGRRPIPRACCAARRRPPRDPAPEEELLRVREPECRAAARDPRPGGDRRLRCRDRRLRPRGDHGDARPGPARRVRRGRRSWPLRRAGRCLHAAWRERGVRFTTRTSVLAAW